MSATMQQRQQYSGAAVGWTVFAAWMMILVGGWWVLAGLVALFNSDFFVVTQEYVFQFDATSWGWIHLILGFLTLAAGFGLFSGAVWARTVGVTLGFITTLVAFAWLPWYPIWAVLLIIAAVSVIWALTVHGRDIVEP